MRLIAAMAIASLAVVTTTATPIGTISALVTMTVFRARSTVHPRRINRLEAPPPERLPMSANRNGIHARRPMSARLEARLVFRKVGRQGIRNQQDGTGKERSAVEGQNLRGPKKQGQGRRPPPASEDP